MGNSTIHRPELLSAEIEPLTTIVDEIFVRRRVERLIEVVEREHQ